MRSFNFKYLIALLGISTLGSSMTEVKYDLLTLCGGSSIPIVEALKSATIRAIPLQMYALSCSTIVLYI